MDEHAPRGPDVIAHPPLIYLGPLLAGSVLDRVVPLPALPARLRRLGLPTAAAGAALGAWFVRTMHAARTPMDPREAPTAIVTGGPFARTRNPGYLGMALIYTGISLAANRRWPLVALPAVIAIVDRGVVRREEAYLTERFGDDYEDYRRRVPRWL
ncbi:MAG TPA: isoprenylcysteine carboxylmethyltransferase family protein [Gaiellales bacterium]|nr:isoprenylcysteine carboxylmethyltransferase family protein [Gaiellales bacterium]